MSLLCSNRYNNINISQFEANNDNSKTIEYNNIKSQRLTKNRDRINNIHILNDNIKKLNHSQTFDNIIKNETNWSKDINEYDYNRKHLPWGKNNPMNYITNQLVYSAQRVFNPITQRYSDKKYENELQLQEKENIKNHIIKAYDSELNKEQIFDIINLEDKLKGLPKDESYNKNGNVFHSRKKGNLFPLTPKKNYNIISNLAFKLHYFDKPEKRPKDDDDNNNDNVIDFYGNGGKQRQKIINTRTIKDYNIITNEYSQYNNEKKKIDSDLQKLIAAKKMKKFRNMNPITGVYYDDKKEAKYQEQIALNNKKLLKKKKEGLFNPFNWEAYDEQELKLKDRNEENKNLRYKVKLQIENFYRKKDIAKSDRYEKALNNKLLYDRYREIEKRKYNIITNNELIKINNNENIRHKKKLWDIIKDGCNENENISKKELSISRDKDDIDKKYNEAKIKKIEKIKSLPRIMSDPFFKIKKFNSKISLNGIDINSNKNININSFSMDKYQWFNENKDVNLYSKNIIK